MLRIHYAEEYVSLTELFIVYDNIRRKGERLRTFGGTASGYKSLRTMFEKISSVIKRDKMEKRKKLLPIDCLDICNIIGENVVIGGVRRTSELAMFDSDDKEVKFAKEILGATDGKMFSHRYVSNNSIMYREKPTEQELENHLSNIKWTGEPGFINAECAKKRNPNFEIVNPCHVGETLIGVADGRNAVSIKQLTEEGKDVPVFCYDTEKEEIAIRTARHFRKTREKAEVWKLTLDDGSHIISTPDHNYMLRTGEERKLRDLKPGDSLMPFYKGCTNRTVKNSVNNRQKVKSVEFYGYEDVYNTTVDEFHNYAIVTSDKCKGKKVRNKSVKYGYSGVIGLNCAEILLHNMGLCNLTTVNAKAFVSEKGCDEKKLLEAARLSARMALRMTCLDLELPDWDEKQKEHRLIGVSVTGWQDAVNYGKLSIPYQEKLLSLMKKTVKTEASSYSKDLGIPEPLLTTCVKPEGSLSLLPGVSAGVHYSHSPYYIRRVRISDSDPLLRVAEDLGWSIHNENGNNQVKVIEFPCASPPGKTKGNVTAIEQMENYKRFMTHYVEHNVSITVHVRDTEWKAVRKWLWENWDGVVAMTFISHGDNGFYKLMPYEETTKEVYEQMKNSQKKFNPSLLQAYEKKEGEYDLLENGCTNGICPVR